MHDSTLGPHILARTGYIYNSLYKICNFILFLKLWAGIHFNVYEPFGFFLWNFCWYDLPTLFFFFTGVFVFYQSQRRSLYSLDINLFHLHMLYLLFWSHLFVIQPILPPPLDRVSLHCQSWPQILDPPALASHLAGTTGMCHHAQL